jgi:hypothetical protein
MHVEDGMTATAKDVRPWNEQCSAAVRSIETASRRWRNTSSDPGYLQRSNDAYAMGVLP